MSKSTTAAADTHIQGNSLTIATLWRVTRTDLVQFFFTDHDQDIDIDVDSPAAPSSIKTYTSTVGGYSRTPIRTSGNLSVDNVDLESSVDRTGGVSERDIRAGLWDYAIVEMFTTNWTSPTWVIKERKGFLGNLSLADEDYSVELRGLVQLLAQVVGEVTTANCQADLGDSRCKVNLEPADWVLTTVYSVGDRVSATTFNARKFIATTAGTSDGTEPTWDTAIGNTTADGTVVWTTEEAFMFEDTILSGIDQFKFNGSFTGETPASPEAQTNGTFSGGLLTGVTGANAGISKSIKNWTYDSGLGTATMAGGPNLDFNDNSPSDDTIVRLDAGSFITDGFVAGQIITVVSSSNNDSDFKVKTVTADTLTLEPDQSLTTDAADVGVTLTADSLVKEIELTEALLFPIVPGDTFKMYIGCNKTVPRCISPFNSINNYRGFPRIPGQDHMLRRPDQPPRN